MGLSLKAVLVLADLSGSRIAFYATAATLLPIIMLALGFQLRTQDIIWSIPRRMGMKATIFAGVIGLFWVLAMSFAEYNAFASLADGRNDNYRFVMLGLVTGLFVLNSGDGRCGRGSATRHLPEGQRGRPEGEH